MSTTEDPIDRILSRKEEILPSSGFTASVMDAVRREAAVPPPIPFPWKRAWPVLALAVAVVIAVPIVAVVELVKVASAPASNAPAAMSNVWPQLPGWASNPMIGWTAGSLLFAYIAVKFSMRLASR